jgi:hypothetical protein
MRTLARVSACTRPAERQLGLRSLVLLPALVVTAAAIHAPAAAALSIDPRWHGGVSGAQTVRRIVEVDENVRPRRAGRRQASVRSRSRRQKRAAERSRQHTVGVRTARERPRLVREGYLAATSEPRPEATPLEERSLVAMHPLLPDPPIARPDRPFAGEATNAEGAGPRCKSAHPNAFAFTLASFGRDFKASEPAMVEGEWPHCRGATRPQSNWRLASLGSAVHAPPPSTRSAERGWNINWRASPSCLASPLRAVLERVADAFGPLTVNSTCRSRVHNARVGGAPRSYHLTGNAVDFRVRSDFGEVLRFLARMRSVGGLTHYGSGVFHIDTGPRRSWAPNSWGRHRVRVARRRA